MIAVSPTDLDWFHQLRAAGLTNNINFWTPTPWNIKGLSPGDRFYFMLKAPYRKIGGYGIFREYVNLPVSSAWEQFGAGNGVVDLGELFSRTNKYAEKRSELDREPSDPTIGCIVLDDCEFFTDDDLIDPESVGLDFPPTIVKLKYFEDDPISNSIIEDVGLKVVTGRAQLAESQKLFANVMTTGSDRSEQMEIGFQGGHRSATVHWRSDLDLWMNFSEVETRYWTAFGIGNPFEGGPRSIVVEINSPFDGIERRIGGVFLKDESGNVYIGHRGRVGGGRRGIGQEAFMASVDRKNVVEFADGDKTSKAVLISRLDAHDLPQQVASFVNDVKRFKTNAIRDSSVWWVNQGKTYKAERDGGFLWAPKETKSGNVASHHKNVDRAQVPDVLLHYVDGGIRAIGQVVKAAVEAPRPDEQNDEPPSTDGWLARVQYWELDRPIDLLEIPAELRSQSQGGPFNRHHGIKQGYLFQLDDGVATAIRQSYTDRWPVDSPWYVESGKDNALHILLKWKQSLDVSTIDRHKSIANEFGSVWWGKFGEGKVAKRKIDRLVDQIANSVPTFAFLYRQGEVWRTNLLNATVESGEVPADRIPRYYSKDDCGAFFEISEFEPLPPTWPSENLLLASKPDEPERMPGALGNQATPLFVIERSPMVTTPPPGPTEIPDMGWLVEKTLWPQDRLEISA